MPDQHPEEKLSWKLRLLRSGEFLFDPGEQLRRWNLETVRQLEDRVERRLAFAFLDPGNRGLVHTRRPSQLLLRQVTAFAYTRDVGGEPCLRRIGWRGHGGSLVAPSRPEPARLS